MSTETFLRLPAEKRGRILDAAWEEFTGTSFADASINRIVRRAGIPRGSFYQYFTDKSDLFHYLMSELHTRLLTEFDTLMKRTEGDLFRTILLTYDTLQREEPEEVRPEIRQVINMIRGIVRNNPGLELEKLLTEKPDAEFIAHMMRVLDLSMFRRRDEAFIVRVSCMAGMCLGEALVNGLAHPEGQPEFRAALVESLNILRRGSMRPKALRERGASV